jgi:hypothetical protein
MLFYCKIRHLESLFTVLWRIFCAIPEPMILSFNFEAFGVKYFNLNRKSDEENDLFLFPWP